MRLDSQKSDNGNLDGELATASISRQHGHELDAQRAIPSTFTGADGRVFPTTTFLTDSLNIAGAAFGFKLNPASTFLVTFNVLVKLNNGGLRDDVVPLIGISFTP